MLQLLRSLRGRADVFTRLPGLFLAFAVAELFYKFHSFTLECGAFLLTWLVLDIVVDRLLRVRPTPSP